MTSAELTDLVKQEAKKLGFHAVAVARAEPLFQEHERYVQWLRAGYHADMKYMERGAEPRRDVEHILPGARSVIVLASNYYTPQAHGSTGKIARYAWGDDYHVVLPPLLDELIGRLHDADPASLSKRYTDTGPVMEKAWAVRSGLGWQGKNGNIIRRDIGSWFFISVIITTANLDPDEPMDDYCGTCTACIDNCPTRAIVQPAVVDSRKCISYWTIEAKPDVDIPLPVAQQMDGWLFGCDVCQDVCPWNRFEQPTDQIRFSPRGEQTTIDPLQIVNLQPETFVERFRHSPLKRPKLAGLQRNARTLLQYTQPDTSTEQQ